MNRIRKITSLIIGVILFMTCAVSAQEWTGYTLPDGSAFDVNYYIQANADVVAVVGTNPQDLMDHYWYKGIQEGRKALEAAPDVGANAVISAVNAYRQENGLPLLSQDDVLMNAAQSRARELADQNMFAHTRPDGQRWQTILGDNLASYKRVGENLGRGQSSVQSAMHAWQVSPAHNALLLHADMNKIGCGVAKSTEGKYYFVLIIGKSK